MTTESKTNQHPEIDELFGDLTPKTPSEAIEFERISNLVRFRAFDPAANSIRAKGLIPKIIY